MAHRIDRGTLKPAQRRTDGTVVVDARPTRAGVFEYLLADGTVRCEWRSTAEVFKADSLASLNLRSITNNHPAEMVTADTARAVTVGTTGQDARRDGEFVAASCVVYDAEAIADMAAGKRELSCGYECDIISTPGVVPAGEPDAGKHYDVAQINIAYNHVALVDFGRAGPQCVARFDAAIMKPAADRGTEQRKAPIMDPKELAALMAENAANKARADAADAARAKAEAERDAERGRADAADAARAKAEADRDTAIKARTDAAANIGALVKARVKLEAAAAAAGVDKFDSLDDRAIKVAVVEKLDGTKIADTESIAYVDGRFDSAVERATQAGGALAKLRAAAEGARTDTADTTDPEAAALAKLRADNANRYKAPVAS